LINGDAEDDHLGSSVSGAGDVDGDGFADLIVGVPNNHSGSARVISFHVTPEPPTAIELLESLLEDVVTLNLNTGIENSLDAKLDAVFLALNDAVDANDEAVINLSQAFINAFAAQSGKQISVEDASALIASAEQIIALLGEA
jgi:hypothetical protein